MAISLQDDFLKDLEDLSDNEEEKEPDVQSEEDSQDFQDPDDNEQESRAMVQEDEGEKYLKKHHQSKNFSKFLKNAQFEKFIEEITQEIEKNSKVDKNIYLEFFVSKLNRCQDRLSGIFPELDGEQRIYGLVVQTNEYLKYIDSEIFDVHKKLRDLYAERFLELEKIVLNPIEYAKAVEIIMNKQDLSSVDSDGMSACDKLSACGLPNTTILSITVAFSATTLPQLSPQTCKMLQEHIRNIIYLDQMKSKMLQFILSQMDSIAPNLSHIVGGKVAAKLIASAGGIKELAKIPACNIQVMGSQKKNLNGFSVAQGGFHRGHLNEVDIVQGEASKWQLKIVRMLSTKSAIAARIDAQEQSKDGDYGKKLREQIIQRLQKIQAPQQPKLKKILPKPDDKPRRKRGGKRYRKQKEKLQMTLQRKYQNQIPFGLNPQLEDTNTGKTFGMLGVSGSGKLKVQQKKDQGILKKRTQLIGGSSGATNGLASSLAMTPQQAISLINPDLIEKEKKRIASGNIPGTQSYFSSNSGFQTVLQSKKLQGGNQGKGNGKQEHMII